MAIGKKKSTSEFITDARKVHGDKYDYSKVVYLNAKTDVIIICPIHGKFPQSPSNHLRGANCPACSNRPKITTEVFIKRAKELHGDKYDYSLSNYINAKTKIKIICDIHGLIEILPDNFIGRRASGCNECGNIITSIKAKKTTDIFVTQAKLVHGDKYDYSLVNYGISTDIIKIICPIHGVFPQEANCHLRGVGCPRCAKYGYQKGLPGSLYFLMHENKTHIKTGITKDLLKREKYYDKPLQKRLRGFDWEWLTYFTFEDGNEAWKLEQDIKKDFADINAGWKGFGGATEWFVNDGRILERIKELREKYPNN